MSVDTNPKKPYITLSNLRIPYLRIPNPLIKNLLSNTKMIKKENIGLQITWPYGEALSYDIELRIGLPRQNELVHQAQKNIIVVYTSFLLEQNIFLTLVHIH